MTNKIINIIVGIVAVIALIFGGMAYSRSGGTIPFNAGSSAGTEHSFRESFSGGASFGGSSATTTSTASYTTVARDFGGLPTVISILPNLNTTITLSSTSTLAYVPNVGDTADIYIRNASTTQAASITFAAADANLDVQFAEATGGDLVLTGLDWEKVTLIHTSQFLVTAILDEMTEGD